MGWVDVMTIDELDEALRGQDWKRYAHVRDAMLEYLKKELLFVALAMADEEKLDGTTRHRVYLMCMLNVYLIAWQLGDIQVMHEIRKGLQPFLVGDQDWFFQELERRWLIEQVPPNEEPVH